MLLPMFQVFSPSSAFRAVQPRRPTSGRPQGEREGGPLPFANGKSYAQIAAIKGSSPVTIQNIIYRIQEKLGAGTKREVVIWAMRNGLLDDMEPSS